LAPFVCCEAASNHKLNIQNNSQHIQDISTAILRENILHGVGIGQIIQAEVGQMLSAI
jgi:hypothetical protein